MEEDQVIKEINNFPLEGASLPDRQGLEGLSHLVAVSENNVIGKNNGLPWHLPDDFKFFKNKTWGMPVVMGRKTFESMEKDLKGRINIIITSNNQWKRENVIVASSIQEGIKKAAETDCKEIFIIGGGEVFKQTMELASRLYITRVHATIEGDTFYPVIDEMNWKKVSEDFHPPDDKHRYAFTFQTWERKKL